MKPNDKAWAVLPWLLIPLATFLVYLPAINGGLIMDDAEHITPPALQSLGGLARIWFDVGATPHYYPVLNSVFWLEHHLWGSWPVGYHAVNILQQAGAACLVVLLARRLNFSGAWLAGLLFAVHPVHVESVAWISEQKNTLSTVLALAAALVYFQYEETRRPVRYWQASGLFLLALLTKTVVAVVPPAILVTLWWRRGRLDWRRDVGSLLPWFVVGAALGLFSAWFEQVHSHAQGDAFQLPLGERALLAGRAVWFYARTLAWPADLLFINPRWTIDAGDPRDYAGLAAVVVVGLGLLVAARKWRGPLATYLLFIGMLFPVLGFLNINWFNFSFVANHFQHLPSVGVIIPFAAVLTGALRRLTRNAGVGLGAPTLLVAALAWAARLHCEDYRSPQTLYARTVEQNPACWLAHNNLGVLLMEEPGQLARATHHFRQALTLKPDHARAHNNYATALLRAGRAEDALAHYRQSLALQGSVPEVHLHYAQALQAAGGPGGEAEAHLGEAIRLRPGYAEARLARADLLAGLPGRQADAIAAYRDLLRLDPGSAEACNNLGALLGENEATWPEAIRWLTRAAQLAPDYADAHFNLGLLLARQPGHRDEAVTRLREVVRLRPDDPEARHYLAALLLRSREGLAEAAVHLAALVRLRPDSAGVHVGLAQVLAQIPGRAREAETHFRQALALEPDHPVARAALAGAGVSP
jgi:Flp pilus assembly protein TadD